jgi:hypothetical protein
MLNNEYYKLKHIKNSTTIKLFVDCSFIYNMYGIVCKVTNPEYKKKKSIDTKYKNGTKNS